MIANQNSNKEEVPTFYIILDTICYCFHELEYSYKYTYTVMIAAQEDAGSLEL